jgi:hypothetical protein
MNENINNTNERIEAVDNQETDTSVDYISAINEIKANSVSKSEYNKLREENQNLLKTLVEGGTIKQEEYVMEKVDIEKLRKELFDPDASLTNLEYVKKSLDLRNAVIDNGGVDPFLPFKINSSYTSDEIATANKVASIFEECIEYADGNSELFTQELMRRTEDAMPMRGRR